MLEDIQVSKIRSHISNRLMNKFKAIGIKTIGDVILLSVDDFSKTKSVGTKTVSEFSELKGLLETNPKSLVNLKSLQGRLEFEVPNELYDIKISSLRDSIGNKLKNVLEKMNCMTIRDIVKINSEDLSGQPSVGEKTIEEFNALLSMIYKVPDAIKEESNKYSPKMLPSIFGNAFFENVEKIISEYFTELNDSKAQDVFAKRHGLFGNNQYTLEEIGLYYELTRERIRQIEDIQKEKIFSLFRGAIIKKPYVFANGDVTSTLERIEEEFSHIDFIPEATVIDKIKEKNIVEKNPNTSIFLFVFEMIGFAHSNYDKIGYFFNREKFDNGNFHLLCNSIVAILQQVVKPINLFDLVIKLKKSKIIASNIHILYALSLIHFIEKIDVGGEEKFQIEFYKLASLKDKAYRILLENKNEMHAKDIFREIQHRLVISGQRSRDTDRSLKGQLVSDERFKAIGRTGKWILSEWNYNTQSIIELVINAFHHYNEPCSTKMIVDYISTIREDVRYQSVPAILLQHKNKFLKVGRGLYILKEWKSFYSNATDIGEITEIVTVDELHRYLQEIFRSSSKPQLLIKELQEMLKQYDVYWPEHYCHVRFNKCPFLRKEKKGIRNYYSIIENVDIPPNTKSKGKLDLLKNSIMEYVSEHRNGEVPLREVIKKFTAKGEIKANVYGVINASKGVFGKKTKEGIVYLSIIEKDGVKKSNSNSEKAHWDNIRCGEGRKIEFKSSLRWDLQRKEVNRDLELTVIKAIAAFLNTDGGNLYIGVDDNSNILGIDYDIKTLKKRNEDGLILQLNQLLTNYLGKTVFGFIDHSIITISDNRVLSVEVKKSNKPVYIHNGKEKIFVIRAAASVQALDIEEATDYITRHWHNM